MSEQTKETQETAPPDPVVDLQSFTIMPPAIAFALSKLQAEVKTVIKGAKNEHFGNTYAELADVQNAALPLLSKHKLALSQWPVSHDGKHFLRSYLVHESGVGVVNEVDLLLTKNDPQGLGSAITYQRRQTTMAILGLSAEDDDDGNKAANRQAKPSEEQISEIRQYCVDLKFPKEQADARLLSLRTEDHATVAIANLRKLMTEKAKILNNDLPNAIPVFTGDRDQVIPPEVIDEAKATIDKNEFADTIYSRLLKLTTLTGDQKRQLIRDTTGKPVLKMCSEEELYAMAEVVDQLYQDEQIATNSTITPAEEPA